jgi:hypothetical protein
MTKENISIIMMMLKQQNGYYDYFLANLMSGLKPRGGMAAWFPVAKNENGDSNVVGLCRTLNVQRYMLY